MTGLKTRLALAVGVPAALAMVGGAIAFAADSGGGSAGVSASTSQYQFRQAGHHSFHQSPVTDANADANDNDCPNKHKGAPEETTSADQT